MANRIGALPPLLAPVAVEKPSADSLGVDIIFVGGSDFFKDLRQPELTRKLREGRAFLQAHTPLDVPRMPAVTFQTETKGLKCCTERAEPSDETVDLGMPLSYCPKHDAILACEAGLRLFDVVMPRYHLESSLLHEHVHSAQNKTYPQTFAAFSNVVDKYKDVARLCDQKAHDIQANLSSIGFAPVDQLRNLYRKRSAANRQMDSYRLVIEGHAHHLEQVFQRHLLAKNEAKPRYTFIQRIFQALVFLFFRSQSAWNYYIAPPNKAYRAGAAVFRQLDAMHGEEDKLRRGAGNDTTAKLALDRLFERPETIREFLPYYDTWFTWHSASYVDRQQLAEFCREVRNN